MTKSEEIRDKLEERRAELRANSYQTIQHSWSRGIEDEEVERLRAVLAKKYHEMEKVKEEKRQATKEYNKEIKDLEKAMGEISPVIASGSRLVEEEVYGEPNHETNKMEFYDVHGELVFERPLKSNERQLSITGKTA